MKVTVDGYTRILLSVITVLLTVLAVGMWCETPSTVPSASAQGIPDSGKQLDEISQKLSSIDKSIAELQKVLVSGAAKVQVVEAKATKKDTVAPPLKMPVQK
jgi:peptidoglycan hydrolase CwlO-like protein